MKIKKKYKKFFKYLIPFLIVSGSFGVGFFFGVSSWKSRMYVEVKSPHSRQLASGKTEPTLYSVSLEELQQPIQDKLFKNAKIEDKGGQFKFYLGNFIVPDSSERGYMLYL